VYGTWVPNVNIVRRLYDALCYVSDFLSNNLISFSLNWFWWWIFTPIFQISNFSILDDMEMYEHQDPFKLMDFIAMSYFLNQFLYKAVLTNLFGKSISVYFFVKSLIKKKNRKNFKIDTHRNEIYAHLLNYRCEVSIQQSFIYLTLHSSNGNLSTRLSQNFLPGRSLVS